MQEAGEPGPGTQIRREQGSRRGYSEGESENLASAHTLYVWGPIVLVLLAFSR